MENFGIGSWLHRRRPKSSNKTALISGSRELSYMEFAERSVCMANALRDRGVAKGDRLAYLGENHPAFLETLFAAGLLGAIFVPLNTRLAPPEIQFQLRDCGARILIHSQSLNELGTRGSDSTPVTRRIVVNDGADSPAFENSRDPGAVSVEDFEAVLESGSDVFQDETVGLEDAAMILYTSGTTGRPKGALLTHGNVVWNCMNVIVDFDFSSTDVALMISPMFHVASLDMGVLPTLLKGGTVVLEARFDPKRTLELIEKHRATTLSGVPTTFQMLCEHPDWAGTDLRSLTKLTCGGSAVPLRVLDAYEQRDLHFSNGYGMTETAPGATSLPAYRSREKAGSSGLPHFFTDVRITDFDGNQTPPEVVGEIQIKGPNVISQYWNRPEAMDQSITADGWFKSGDIGYKDTDGFVFISDRLKDMIISGGENIYPAEVEQAITELDAVASVAVIGLPDENGGKSPRRLFCFAMARN